MEIQFQKTVIPCLRTICRQYATQEQTQELRLPDGMPDIGTVLCGWGQPIVRGKEWHNGNASVTGGIMVWVLYIPEDGSGVQQVETWLPFQQSWDFTETAGDGNLQVIPMLRSVDARTLSARKLMVRASIGLLGQATTSGDVEIYSPGQLPEDVKVLSKSYPVQLPVEAGEKAFSLEETLNLPNTAVPVQKILRYTLIPKLTEEKVVSDKLVFRGIANVSLLYLGTDGQLYTWDWELPFSQYTQLNTDYEPNTQAQVSFAVTNLELELGAENEILLKAGLTGQCTVYAMPMLELVEDAYSPNRPVSLQKTSLRIPAVLDSKSTGFCPQETISADLLRVVDVTFSPEQPHIHRQGDSLDADLSGVFQILAYSPDMELQTATARWEQTWNLDADGQAAVEICLQPEGKTTATLGAGDVRLQGEMTVQTTVTAQQGLQMLTGIELGEVAEPNPDRPSIILCRAGDRSLWDIAKESGSTVEAIENANRLQSPPDPAQMLIIPVL